MIKQIDAILNKVTMYRLVVYELLFLLVVAIILSAIGLLSFNPFSILFSAAFIFLVCWVTNRIFAYAIDAPYNPESTWITALILALIITPPNAVFGTIYLPLAFWAATLAIASKYILAVQKKHIFNPAAFGVAATGAFLGLSASWWLDAPVMALSVLLGGLLIVRKVRRFDMWRAFIVTFTAGTALFALEHGYSFGNFF